MPLEHPTDAVDAERINIRPYTPWEDMLAYSRAVRIGNLVAIGQTSSVNASGQIQHVSDAYRQAIAALANVEVALKAVGAALSDVIRSRIYVAGPQHLEYAAKAHAEVFKDIRPACTILECRMISPKILVEFEVDAVVLDHRPRLNPVENSKIEVVDRQVASHYKWGRECDGWHFTSTADLSVISERMPSGAAEVRHYHKYSRQFFYVLRGALVVIVGDREFRLNEGQGINIQPGQPHEACNRSDADVEFLVVSTPPSHDDRVPIKAPSQ